MSKINGFLSLALPYINAGQRLDIAALAREAGIDPELAAEILQTTMGRINEMRKF